MLVAKEIIRPGTYWYQDKDGKPQKLVVDAQFVKHLKDQGNAMIRAGLSIPVPVEHQQDAKPLTQNEKSAQRLRDNAGWVTGYTIQPGNRLAAVLDIQDPDIAKKLPKTIRWTSPHINSFVDGNGRQWDGVISHVALTSRPRIVQQEPFPSIAAALSLVQSLHPQNPIFNLKSVDIIMSRAGLLEQRGGSWLPAIEAAFSIWAGVKGVKLDLEPDALKKEKTDDEVAADPDAIPIPGAEDQGKLIDDEGAISVYEMLNDLLPSLGVPMPETCTADNFLECLYKAVVDAMKEKIMKSESEANKPVTDPAKQNGDMNPVLQEQQPLYMSLEDIGKIADPALKATALRAAAVERRALTEYGRRRQARIDALAKRLPTQKARDMLMSLTKDVRLSLSSDGEIRDPTEAAIATIEETAGNVPDLLRRQLTGADNPGMQFGSGVQVQPHPEWGGEAMSQDRAAAVIDEWCTNTGIPNPNASKAGNDKVTALVDKLLGTA